MSSFHAYLNDYLFCYLNDSSEANQRLTEILGIMMVCDACSLTISLHKNPFEICWQGGNISSLIRGNKELKTVLAGYWNRYGGSAAPKNSDDNYEYRVSQDEEVRIHNVSETVMADAYEAHSREHQSILLNLAETVPSPVVVINKNSKEAKEIHSYASKDEIVVFFQTQKILKRYYDMSCKYVPNDSETILSDTSLFTPTSLFNKGARLYERKGNTDELWCRDTKHFGNSVHLEIFSRNQNKQIYVSRHDEICFFRKLTKKEANRKLFD